MAEIKQVLYELHAGNTSMPFVNETDVINALALLGTYHDMAIDREAVRKSLEEHLFYDAYPLAVSKKIYY